MRQFTLILLLLGILMTVGMIRAQEEETVLYLRLECDCGFDSYLDVVISQLARNMETYNVRLEIAYPNTESTMYSDWTEFLLVRLVYDTLELPDNDYEVHQFSYEILSQRLTKAFSELSPLLKDQIIDRYVLATCIPVDSCDYETDILTVMALYSLNRCDLLDDYANLVVENRGETYLSLVAIAYQANCAILAGDYVTAQALLAGIPWSLTIYSSLNAENLAWLYIQNNQSSNAIQLMTDWLDEIRYAAMSRQASDIGIINVLKLRAQIYALAFDYDSAIADMDEAITLAERGQSLSYTLPELYTIRGQIIFLLYEWDRVLENFNHAIELDPNYAPAYFERGVLYYTMTQRENALADFQHYLELEANGLYAEEAAQYIESIEIELEALGG
jgi:tetratricopeptide (TPR) repeat protein